MENFLWKEQFKIGKVAFYELTVFTCLKDIPQSYFNNLNFTGKKRWTCSRKSLQCKSKNMKYALYRILLDLIHATY